MREALLRSSGWSLPVTTTPPKRRDMFKTIQNFVLSSPDAHLSPVSQTADCMFQTTKLATLCSHCVGSKYPDFQPQDDDVTVFELTTSPKSPPYSATSISTITDCICTSFLRALP